MPHLGDPRLAIHRIRRLVDAWAIDGARAVVAVIVADARRLRRARVGALLLRHVRRIRPTRRAGLAVQFHAHIHSVIRAASALSNHCRIPSGQLDIWRVNHIGARLVHPREEQEADDEPHRHRDRTKTNSHQSETVWDEHLVTTGTGVTALTQL